MLPAFNGPRISWKRTTVFINYTLSSLENNTDGPFSIPATGDLRATITNPNPSRVRIGQLQLDTSQGTGGFSANAANCALSFASQNNGGNGWTIAGSGTLTIDLQSSLTMGTSAASSCQNQTFTVYLKAG